MDRAIEAQVARAGLRLAGVLQLRPDETAELPGNPVALVLLGSTAGAFWDAFELWSARPQLAPGEHPLDCFTRELVAPLAGALGARAVYPSDGPPFWPFQSWAARVEQVFTSPLKILIHPEFGLWHAYRAALLFDSLVGLPGLKAASPVESPCVDCSDKPCLTACPVEAYSTDGYDVQACSAYIANTDECRSHGCGARRACPVGGAHQYSQAQQQFHLRAFLGARSPDASG